MDIVALKAEISTDPLARGYAAMSDGQIAESLSQRNRQVDNEYINGGDVLACIDLAATDWGTLNAAQRDYMIAACAAQSIPNVANLRQQLKNLFPDGTGTDNRLTALLRRSGSRAEELGLGNVTPSDVADAKRA